MHASVTGATGFIGRRLVDRLLAAGHRVSALVRSDAHDLPGSVRCVTGCVEQGAEAPARAMEGCDIVFHLAACVSFDPRRTASLLRVNGEGTREVLKAARSAGVSRVVVVSSACTIGLSDAADRVLDEETPLDDRLVERNPYLRSKYAAEAFATQAAEAGQWVTIVNPTTVFGAPDRSLNSGTLVRQVVRSAVLPVPPGGSNVVDVEDVVDGLLCAVERGQSGRRYILGGVNLRFADIFSRVAAAVGRRPVMVRLPVLARRPMAAAAWVVQRCSGSPFITPQIVADTFRFKFFSCRRAEEELGWRARREFTETLAAAWAYYQREGLTRLSAGAVT